MILKDLARKLELKVRCAEDGTDRPVSGGYAGDLLSDALAHAKKDYVWVTLQTHQNIVGVASLKEVAGIIIVNGREPEAQTLEKAHSEGIPIMVTAQSAFDIVGRLYQLGIHGAANAQEV
jgi:hypothetical protein